MNDKVGPKVRTRPRNGKTCTTTKPTAQGVAIPVTDPLDLWYLCQKATYARRFDYKRSGDGRVAYQRRVSLWVRKDCENFEYRFPYCGEVGFKMVTDPPEPVMSQKEPHRPSHFPLSRYQLITHEFLNLPNVLKLKLDLIDKSEIEAALSPWLMQPEPGIDAARKSPGAGNPKSIRGLLRIPDIVRLKAHDHPGKAQYSQGNLRSVIEMKFPGDVLTNQQQEAYERIAGPAGLRILYTDVCEKANEQQWREWVMTVQDDPVYKPVVQSTSLAPLMRNLDKNSLLVSLIDAEHEAARRSLGVQPAFVEGPQLKAAPDPRAIQTQNRRAVAGIEMTLAAPFVAAGSAALAVVGGSALSSLLPPAASSSATVLASSAGQPVAYRSLIGLGRKLIPAAGAAAVPAYATPTLSPLDDSNHERRWERYANPFTTHDYLFWEDRAVKTHD